LPVRGLFRSEIEISSCNDFIKVQANHNYIAIQNQLKKN